MATLTRSTGTVTLSGAAEKVILPAVFGWVWVKNMSDSDIFAGLSADISEGADGVMTIPSGECGRVQADGFSSVYLLGTGNALVVAQNYADCPFKSGAKGGEIPDLSAYAKKTDIPTELPANGGNADTVKGVGISDVGKKGLVEISTDYGVIEIGTHIDFHTAEGQDFDGRISKSDKFYFHNSDSSKGTLSANIDGDASSVGGKLPEKIFYDNGISSDLDSANQSGSYVATPDTLNAPIPSWWIVDTMNYNGGQFIVQKAHEIGDTAVTASYIRNYANGAWSDWSEIYTTGNKPYIAGSATVAANSDVCVTNHGFTPSAVLWWENSGGREIRSASSFNTTSFNPSVIDTSERVLNYIIFK